AHWLSGRSGGNGASACCFRQGGSGLSTRRPVPKAPPARGSLGKVLRRDVDGREGGADPREGERGDVGNHEPIRISVPPLRNRLSAISLVAACGVRHRTPTAGPGLQSSGSGRADHRSSVISCI